MCTKRVSLKRGLTVQIFISRNEDFIISCITASFRKKKRLKLMLMQFNPEMTNFKIKTLDATNKTPLFLSLPRPPFNLFVLSSESPILLGSAKVRQGA